VFGMGTGVTLRVLPPAKALTGGEPGECWGEYVFEEKEPFRLDPSYPEGVDDECDQVQDR
jgi:hypothetical protein